ncbi:MAG TPA: methyltransferase domain-containing protein [Acidimicrobiales bacterium]|nr:methyltransferase domain-containing protein [Acidimicrobiales bacterium]
MTSGPLEVLGRALTGAHVAGMVALGVELGLYRSLVEEGPATSDELAGRTGCHERWVREWLYGQAAAGVIDFDPDDQRFSAVAELGPLLCDRDDLFHLGGQFRALPRRLGLVDRLAESFRTGLGLDFDDRGAGAAADTEATFLAWYRQVLVPVALPLLDGVVPRLAAGTEVADVGCGSGVALVEMAKAFPAACFHGYDVSRHALARAEANRAEAGVANVSFHLVPDDPLPEDGRYGLVCTFDCLHDMTDPGEVAGAIRRSMADDGVWFVVDIDGAPTFAEQRARPMAPMLYALSVYSCMSSSLSRPGGAGLGTCGLPEPAMRELTGAAGFTRFRRLPMEHPVNAFYEARP